MSFGWVDLVMTRVLVWGWSACIITWGLAWLAGSRGVDVGAVQPLDSLFTVEGVDLADGSARPATGDFLSRPLFDSSRRPPVDGDEPSAEMDVPKSEVNGLEGVELLGLYGSGEVRGALLLTEKGTTRVMIGESFGVWKLLELKERQAVFGRASSGDLITTSLEMPVASTFQSSVVEQAASQVPESDVSADDGVLTFDSIYKKRRQKNEEDAGNGQRK